MGLNGDAMSKSKFHEIQYVLACFSTHSKYIKGILNEQSIIKNNFNIHEDENVKLVKFIESNYDRFYTAAKLSEEKRWREMLLSIKHSVTYCDHHILKIYWYKYLETFGIKDSIPISSIHESIRFIKYLLACGLSNEILIDILNYELLRNNTLLYEFNESDSEIHFDDIIFNHPDEYSIRLNSSFNLKQFNYRVSKMVESLTNKKEILKDDSYRNKEIVGFYKHTRTGNVNSIKLNEQTNLILEYFKNEHILLDSINQIANLTKLNQQQCSVLIKTIYQKGITSIKRLSKEKRC